MKIQGTFCPPVIGTTAAPIKIAGPGTLEITEGELSAVAEKSRNFSLLLAVVVVFLILAGGILGAAGVPKILLYAILGGIFGVTYGLLSAFGKRKGRQEIRHHFPRTAIKSAQSPQEGLVVIRIINHRPKGDLFFRPESDTAVLMAALGSTDLSSGTLAS